MSVGDGGAVLTGVYNAIKGQRARKFDGYKARRLPDELANPGFAR